MIALQKRSVLLLQDRYVAAQANRLRIPGEHQRARDGRIDTATIDVGVGTGLHPAQTSPVAHIDIVL